MIYFGTSENAASGFKMRTHIHLLPLESTTQSTLFRNFTSSNVTHARILQKWVATYDCVMFEIIA